MKKMTMLFLVFVLLFATTCVLADDCSCTAHDNSCSTSVSCPDPCYAICVPNGRCLSGCGHLSIPPKKIMKDLASEININAKYITPYNLLGKIDEGSQLQILDPVSLKAQRISVDFKRQRLVDVLRYLGSFSQKHLSLMVFKLYNLSMVGTNLIFVLKT